MWDHWWNRLVGSLGTLGGMTWWDDLVGSLDGITGWDHFVGSLRGITWWDHLVGSLLEIANPHPIYPGPRSHLRLII